MKTFKLDEENKSKGFIFLAPSAFLKITKVSLQIAKDSSEDWPIIMSKLKLKAILRQTVFQSNEIEDERTESFPIHLGVDPYQKQSVIVLNQTIENKTFKIGLSDKKQFYTELVFELDDSENKDEPWSLLFEYEMADAEEK